MNTFRFILQPSYEEIFFPSAITDGKVWEGVQDI